MAFFDDILKMNSNEYLQSRKLDHTKVLEKLGHKLGKYESELAEGNWLFTTLVLEKLCCTLKGNM